MKEVQKPVGANDLIPGIVAALTFLAIFFFHLTPLWVAALLAFGVYVGVRFVMPTPKTADVPIETTASILAGVKALAERMPDGSSRVRIRNIIDVSESLLRYGDAQPEKVGDSLFVVRQYLESLRVGLGRYLETLQYTPDSARQSQRTLSDLLETVYSSLKHLHSELVEKETADLTGDLTALNRTLHELDKVWLNLEEKQP